MHDERIRQVWRRCSLVHGGEDLPDVCNDTYNALWLKQAADIMSDGRRIPNRMPLPAVTSDLGSVREQVTEAHHAFQRPPRPPRPVRHPHSQGYVYVIQSVQCRPLCLHAERLDPDSDMLDICIKEESQ